MICLEETANEDEQGWVCSGTSAPANHIFPLHAQGWQREHCGEELPASNPEQGRLVECCTVLARRQEEAERHGGGWERAAVRALHPQEATTSVNAVWSRGRVGSGTIHCWQSTPRSRKLPCFKWKIRFRLLVSWVRRLHCTINFNHYDEVNCLSF